MVKGSILKYPKRMVINRVGENHFWLPYRLNNNKPNLLTKFLYFPNRNICGYLVKGHILQTANLIMFGGVGLIPTKQNFCIAYVSMLQKSILQIMNQFVILKVTKVK